jgi:hypothetical protein
MTHWNRRRGVAGACGALLLLHLLVTACTNQMEPARRALGEIQAAVGAAAADAALYVPDRLAAVRQQLGALEASFDRQDYGAVLNGAPAVLSAAQELPDAAAAAKAGRRRALADEWTGLATELPGRIEAVQRRIDSLAARNGVRRRGAGGAGTGPRSDVDLDAARAGLDAAESLWSKSQAAFATGNLEEAAETAKRVATQVDALAGAMR